MFSYRQSIPTNFLLEELAFKTRDDCLQFLEPFGLTFTDDTKNFIDCKISMSALTNIWKQILILSQWNFNGRRWTATCCVSELGVLWRRLQMNGQLRIQLRIDPLAIFLFNFYLKSPLEKLIFLGWILVFRLLFSLYW